MVSLWWHEAGRFGVLPILGRAPRPALARDPEPVRRYTYYPDTAPVFIEAAPDTVNANYVIRAELEIVHEGANGMVLAQGGKFGGYALLLLDGRPRFIYNYLGLADTVLESSRCLPVGRVTLTFVFQKTGAPSHSKAYGAPGMPSRSISVSTLPGQIAFTETLAARSSSARARVRPTTPCLAAQ